jgi:prepilin-type N-terminal cleavage/methylation domain-containing protein
VRRSSGFTIVEIIVVLLLMSIVAATLLGRSVTTANIDLNSAADKLRNQLRFAQAEAMKHSDAVWGIQSDGSTQYWMFRATPTVTEDVIVPGGDYASGSTRIRFSDLKASLTNFIVVFDKIGKPYTGHANGLATNQVDEANPVAITVTKDGTRTITITPETGLCVIQ